VYGIVFASRDAYEDADSFIQASIDNSKEKSVVAWTVRGLIFDLTDRPEEAAFCHMEARWTQVDIDEGGSPGEERRCRSYKDKLGVDIWNKKEGGPAMLQATRFLLDMHATILAEKALLAYEVQIQGSSKAPPANVKLDHLILQGRLNIQLEEYTQAEECLMEAIYKERPRTSRMSSNAPAESAKPRSIFSVEMWTLLAHAQYLQKKSDAINSYTTVLEMREAPFDNMVYLRLGRMLTDSGTPEDLERAKQVFLKACTTFPTASSWLGVGIACYHRRQYEQAEEALIEANLRDIDNGVVWGFICLVCMQLQRDEEADRALHLALRRGIDRPEVLREIGFVYVAAGKPAIAESALREALTMQEDASVRRALADALAAQNDPEAAIIEYKKVMETYENEEDRKQATVQLQKLLTAINRPSEAAKYKEKTSKESRRPSVNSKE